MDADGVVWDVDDLDSLDNDHNGFVDDLVGWKFVIFSPGDNYPYPNTLQSGYQHGTIMASVGAVTNNDLQASDTSIAGISWHCKIVPLRIGEGPGYYYSSTAEALGYAATMGIDVVNMSWFFLNLDPLSITLLHEAIIAARNAGVVLVAGVDPYAPTTIKYPHGFEEVIAVTVVNEYGVKETGYGYYSGVDVCGLGFSSGKNIPILTYDYRRNGPTLYPGSQAPHGYWYAGMSTSYACAQVSALAGLLRSMYPDSSVDFIKQEIQRGAIPVDTVPGNESFQGMLGAGRINPYRSLTQWGRVRNDTTWAKFAYVSADLKIDQGKTLTIEPGTIIYFAPDDNDNQYDPTVLEFRVEGELIAEGTAANPIEFRSLSENPQPGDWAGIQVFGNAASASLAYCNISDAYHGIKSYRPVQIAHSNFTNCEVHGIYLEGSGANGSQISNCTANGNGSCGIMLNDCDNVTIGSCEANNNYHGVWLTSSNPGSVNHTSTKYNTSNGIRADNCFYEFDHCYVEDNDQQGMYLTNTRGTISNCKVWKNSANGIYCVGSTCDPAVDHSKIEQNQVGVRVASGGCPKLGDIDLDSGQNNSIFNQPTYVYASPNYVLKAENCWWGTVPGSAPDPDKFKGNVDYFPYLSSDPVQYLASMKPGLADDASTSLSLAQNSPNPLPVAAATIIRYSIPRGTERVTLTIYDVSGRKVKTLVNDVVNGGEYSTTWDCRNQKGNRVVPGIYFYRLSVGTKSLTKKIVLIQN